MTANLKNLILILDEGDELTFNPCDGGCAMVRKENGRYLLFEIPQFGGEERPSGLFRVDEVDKMLEIAANWT